MLLNSSNGVDLFLLLEKIIDCDLCSSSELNKNDSFICTGIRLSKCEHVYSNSTSIKTCTDIVRTPHM